MKPVAIIDRGRGPEVAGTRITVFDVLHYLQAGHSPNYIAAVLSLSTAEVLAAIRYIEEHRDEVLAMNRRIEERIARGNPPEVEAKRQASHEKLLALREELQRRRREEEANGAGDPGRP
jgi:uncharacterized protein (DUF433 family)